MHPGNNLGQIIVDDATGRYYVIDGGSSSGVNDASVFEGNLTDVGVAPTRLVDQPYAVNMPVTGNGSGFQTIDSALQIKDTSGNLSAAFVTITNFNAGAGDQLSVLDGATHRTSGLVTGTNITVSYSNGTLSLTGSDTLAHYQTVLREVQYHSTNSNAANGRDIEFNLSNGVASDSTQVNAPLNFALDNAPTLSVTSAAPTYMETAGSPSAAGTAVALITTATANDADVTSPTAQLAGTTVSISGGFLSGAGHHDTLTFTNSGGITGNYNSATGVLTFTGVARRAGRGDCASEL